MEPGGRHAASSRSSVLLTPRVFGSCCAAAAMHHSGSMPVRWRWLVSTDHALLLSRSILFLPSWWAADVIACRWPPSSIARCAAAVKQQRGLRRRRRRRNGGERFRGMMQSLFRACAAQQSGASSAALRPARVASLGLRRAARLEREGKQERILCWCCSPNPKAKRSTRTRAAKSLLHVDAPARALRIHIRSKSQSWRRSGARRNGERGPSGSPGLPCSRGSRYSLCVQVIRHPRLPTASPRGIAIERGAGPSGPGASPRGEKQHMSWN